MNKYLEKIAKSMYEPQRFAQSVKPSKAQMAANDAAKKKYADMMVNANKSRAASKLGKFGKGLAIGAAVGTGVAAVKGTFGNKKSE